VRSRLLEGADVRRDACVAAKLAIVVARADGGAAVDARAARSLSTLRVRSGCKAAEGVLGSATRGAVDIAEFVVCGASGCAQRAEGRRVAVDAGDVAFDSDVGTVRGGEARRWRPMSRISLLPEAEVADSTAVEGFEVAALARGALSVGDAGLAEPRGLHGGRGGAGIGVAIADQSLAGGLATGSVVSAGALDTFSVARTCTGVGTSVAF